MHRALLSAFALVALAACGQHFSADGTGGKTTSVGTTSSASGTTTSTSTGAGGAGGNAASSTATSTSTSTSSGACDAKAACMICKTCELLPMGKCDQVTKDCKSTPHCGDAINCVDACTDQNCVDGCMTQVSGQAFNAAQAQRCCLANACDLCMTLFNCGG